MRITSSAFCLVWSSLMLSSCGGGGGGSTDSCVSGISGLCASLGATSPSAPVPTPPPPTTPSTPTSTTPPTPATPSPPPLSVGPAALTIGDCTTNIPFIFSGGVPPYTVYTSDNFAVPVGSALQLDANRLYFTATIKALNLTNIIAPVPGPYTATLTVLDSQSHTATSAITVPVLHAACAPNPVLAVAPESANFRATEILAFQVTGGALTSRVQDVTFSDAGIAQRVSTVETNSTTTTVNVQGLSAGTTLMTISSSDGQKANIRLTVLPQ